MLMLGIFACNKVNQWKQPLELCFAIELEPSTAGTTNSFFIEIESVQLALQSFNFDANRAEGADVYFTKQYAANASVLFDATCQTNLQFEIPQGTYSNIGLSLSSKQDQGPGIIVSAKFNNNNQSIPVLLELSKLDDIQLFGVDQQGNQTDLNLDNLERVEATIQIAVSEWFDGVTISMLEEAVQLDVNAQPSIYISSVSQEDIYNQILENLQLNEQIAIFKI